MSTTNSERRRALISVSDKSCLLLIAKAFVRHNIEIISTGGTAKHLRENGLTVTDVSEYTGFPEMMDGRLKTIHPKIHGGLLYIRGNTTHETAAQTHNLLPIDFVVVNLYPFELTVAKPGITFEEAIENIDIGGPGMLRAGAKNHESVTVIVDPSDYGEVIVQLDIKGVTSRELRLYLAKKVFARTGAYDTAIANHLDKALTYRKKFD